MTTATFLLSQRGFFYVVHRHDRRKTPLLLLNVIHIQNMYSSTSVLARRSAGTSSFSLYLWNNRASCTGILHDLIVMNCNFHKADFPFKKQEQFLKDRNVKNSFVRRDKDEL